VFFCTRRTLQTFRNVLLEPQQHDAHHFASAEAVSLAHGCDGGDSIVPARVPMRHVPANSKPGR
jgi:hypothetical protein